MSGESLTMDEGRDGRSSGGGGPINKGGGGGVSEVVGNGDVSGSATSCVSATLPRRFSPNVSRTSSPLKSSGHRGHHGGPRNGARGQGNQYFPQSKSARVPSRHTVSPTGTENVSGVKNPQGNQQSSDRDTGRNSPSTQRQPRRRIRRDKGKWKPYHTLTWEERQERDALETQRAEEKRAQLTHLGYPQAPYNTTQFLMADHVWQNGSSEGIDAPSSDESSTAEEDWTSMDRGYDQEWSRVLSEHLGSLNKGELIAHVLEAEQEKSKLEQRVRSLEREVEDLTTPRYDGKTSDVVGDLEMTVDGC